MLTTDKDINNENLPEHLQKALREIVDICMREDETARKKQLKLWKKNEQFWHGVQFIFWSETKQEWLDPSARSFDYTEEGAEDAADTYYDFVTNIFSAHGEAVVAALSAQVPSVRFPPDDAENPDDIMTGKTFSKIADVIQKHNKVKYLVMHLLYLAWNQGNVYMYHAPKYDRSFGETSIPNYEMILACTNADCGFSAPIEDGITECPECGLPTKKKPTISGFSTSPKRRIVLEAYGGLNVKIPINAKTQSDIGYLSCLSGKPKDYLQSVYPHISDQLDSETQDRNYIYETQRPSGLTNSSYADNTNDLSVNKVWLRPWRFNLLGKNRKEEIEELLELFPDGCCTTFIGDIYAEARNENLDTYWTIGKLGLSSYIHCDAKGQSLVSQQELRNILTNLTVETIEHGIPHSYADTRFLNFQTYSKHESRPGMVYPIHVPEGKAASQGFHESGRATLSREVSAFGTQLDRDSQFVVGSFPSIYGGPSDGKTRTAAEYTQSRQMALQRLSITWALLVLFYADVIAKSVMLYIETMIEDEKYVIKNNDNYVNVWIRKSELSGKVGEVEPEGSDTFPVSTPQKQDLLMKLLGMNNEFLTTALFDSENRRLVAEVLAFPDIFIPGDDQRSKQIREINLMMNGEMIMPEPEVDDDAIHISTLKNFLVGPTGLDLKDTNPRAYETCKQHLAMHENFLATKTMQQFEQNPPGQAPQGVN